MSDRSDKIDYILGNWDMVKGGDPDSFKLKITSWDDLGNEAIIGRRLSTNVLSISKSQAQEIIHILMRKGDQDNG